ncbi:hypothetical protein UB23_01290 [Pseudomonas sp. ES3-33]|nr:hypothetical protein UB23_01290 [Pseudomonas sp. ES3-33]
MLQFTSTHRLDQMGNAKRAGPSHHSLVLMGGGFLKYTISLGLPMKGQIYLQMSLHFVLIVIVVPTIPLIGRSLV